MGSTFRADDCDSYRMEYAHPHRELEPPEKEEAIVDAALRALVSAGIIAHADYDRGRFLAHRRAVAELFEIPWTAITPRVQRLLYSVNAVKRPRVMIAAGVFCGNTFISNAGAAVGPGACYVAEELVGVEVIAAEAQRAERNVRRIDPTGTARVVAAEAVEFVRRFARPIDVLYLDADGAGGRGKGVYLDILEACWERLPPGAVVIAHNSVNNARSLEHYLSFGRDPTRMRASLNVAIVGEGVEISAR